MVIIAWTLMWCNYNASLEYRSMISSNKTHVTLKWAQMWLWPCPSTEGLIEFDKRIPAKSFLNKEKFQVCFATLKKLIGHLWKHLSVKSNRESIVVKNRYSAPNFRGSASRLWIMIWLFHTFYNTLYCNSSRDPCRKTSQQKLSSPPQYRCIAIILPSFLLALTNQVLIFGVLLLVDLLHLVFPANSHRTITICLDVSPIRIMSEP